MLNPVVIGNRNLRDGSEAQGCLGLGHGPGGATDRPCQSVGHLPQCSCQSARVRTRYFKRRQLLSVPARHQRNRQEKPIAIDLANRPFDQPVNPRQLLAHDLFRTNQPGLLESSLRDHTTEKMPFVGGNPTLLQFQLQKIGQPQRPVDRRHRPIPALHHKIQDSDTIREDLCRLCTPAHPRQQPQTKECSLNTGRRSHRLLAKEFSQQSLR